MTQGALQNIVEDMCSFILKEVIPCEGKYHDATSVLAWLEFRELIEISRPNLSRDGYQRRGENFDVYNV